MLLSRYILKHASDHALIRAYRTSDDIDALEVLCQRYKHIVFGLCLEHLHNKEESKDTSMEILGVLIHDLKKYDIHNFKAWLFFVVKNHCLKKLKKTKQLKIILKEPRELESMAMENVDFDNLINGKVKLLRSALKRLNEPQKTCIELFYFEKKSYKEIAEIKNDKVSHIKSHIQNGKRNLKKIMQKADDE